jgi:hypothetical protein
MHSIPEGWMVGPKDFDPSKSLKELSVTEDPVWMAKLTQNLRMTDHPRLRDAKLARIARQNGIDKDVLRQRATTAEIEKLKKNKKLPIYHYHQTSLQNFIEIINSEQKSLLSQNKQVEKGKQFTSSGSRPGLVQFTVDWVDNDGHITKQAVSSVGARGKGVVLVFDESIMTQPNFDIFDYYHGIPEVSLDHVSCLLCNSNEEKERLEQIIFDDQINLRVMLVEEWYKSLEKK